MPAVFDVSPDSRYRKDFWRFYAIPTRPGAEVARAFIGDWVIFRQTGVGGYVAVARVDDVVPDPERPGFFAALVAEYLPFSSSVPLHVKHRYAEFAFRQAGRRFLVGRLSQGTPVRELLWSDFEAIVLAGFSRTLRQTGNTLSVAREPAVLDEAVAWDDYDFAPKDLRKVLTLRAVRDVNFRLNIGTAYRNTCAFTRMSLNDGPHFEVQAAHIWQHGKGPDIVQNGLGLSSTPHWAFDHHLISLDEAYRPLISPRGLSANFLTLLPPAGERVHLPLSPRDWPAQDFLERHRAIFRKKHGLGT